MAADLREDGAIPIEIRAETHAPRAGRTGGLFGPRVRLDELVMFSRQMYTLLRAGVPLIRALNGLAETTRNPALRAALGEVGSSLQSGRDLTTALERHPRVFPPIFVSTVGMGETMGRLEEAFSDLAAHLERDSETLKRIRSAARYPTLVVVAVAGAITLINLFVVPTFAKVFASLGAQLPLPTRILIGTSNLFVYYWPLLLAGLAAAVLGGRAWLASQRGGRLWAEYKLRVPLIGPILRRATLARFARAFALGMRSGVPALQSLRLVARAVDNSFVGEGVEAIGERVGGGETLASSAARSGLFTPLVLQMIAVGEESGSLDELLQEVATYYEREVDYDLKRLSDSIEPILIVALGVVVLVLALGVYLPLWDMARLARGG